MATKKAAKTKRTAGKTAKAPEVFKVPRTVSQMAEGIWAREQRTPGYWRNLQAAMRNYENAASPRVAQDMPREAPTQH